MHISYFLIIIWFVFVAVIPCPDWLILGNYSKKNVVLENQSKIAISESSSLINIKLLLLGQYGKVSA